MDKSCCNRLNKIALVVNYLCSSLAMNDDAREYCIAIGVKNSTVNIVWMDGQGIWDYVDIKGH